MWFIFVLGFIENAFVISVFLLHKSRCTVAEIYLGNMAAADLVFISGLPFWAIYIAKGFYWQFGDFLCVAVNSLIMLNLFASVYFLMMVSIDRYLALVKTMSVGRMRRPWWAKVTCAIIWTFAAVVSLPKFIFRKVTFVPELNTTACIIDAPSDTWHVVNNIILNVVGFLIPVIVIGFCSFQIVSVLRNNTMQKFKEIKNEKRATWLVLSVLLVFIVCWLPFHISAFIDTLDQFKVFPRCVVSQPNEIFNQISTYIGFSNSCINPLLYVIVGNNFRRKAKEVYRALIPRKFRQRGASIQTNYSMETTQSSMYLDCQKKKSIS
ncbi:PREDICTED: B2 bradykinin receptor-like [Nanorana parkeri]|uniref:B2 bradykinin receptor-like n=1 Tax=Nanorana parkeri TaxID=125878 RepID=UPI000854508F|nr:PREDICTED: B2 bradykinin receptor-like [Nanorana parkeri]